MTENNKRIILIISIILIIIFVVVIVLWQFFSNDTDDQVVNTNTSQPATTNTNVTTIDLTNNTNQGREVIIENDNLSMTRLASIFAERYGSYTSESEFKNTLELKVFMTDSLIKTVDKYLAAQPDQSSQGEYMSVVTKVISNKIVTTDDNSGTVELITQRTENIGDTNNVYYQNITLELIYDSDVWLVNKATWGDKQ